MGFYFSGAGQGSNLLPHVHNIPSRLGRRSDQRWGSQNSCRGSHTTNRAGTAVARSGTSGSSAHGGARELCCGSPSPPLKLFVKNKCDGGTYSTAVLHQGVVAHTRLRTTVWGGRYDQCTRAAVCDAALPNCNPPPLLSTGPMWFQKRPPVKNTAIFEGTWPLHSQEWRCRALAAPAAPLAGGLQQHHWDGRWAAATPPPPLRWSLYT